MTATGYPPEDPRDGQGSYGPFPAAGQTEARAHPSGYGLGSGRPRRSRTGLVLGLVLAVVLVGAGAFSWWLLHDGPGARPSSQDLTDPGKEPEARDLLGRDQVGSEWVHVHDQAWSLGRPDGVSLPYDRVHVDATSTRLIRVIENRAGVHVEVFTYGEGAEPRLQMAWDLDGRASTLGVWGDVYVVGSHLINLRSLEVQDAPWHEESAARVLDGQVLACRDTQCSLWSSPTEQDWEQTVPLTASAVPEIGVSVVDHYTYVRNTAQDSRELIILDLQTGQAVSIVSDTQNTDIWPVADGWVLQHHNSKGENTGVSLTMPDGTPKESFALGASAFFTVYPWSGDVMTLDQARAWLKDGDTSWAQASLEVNIADEGCNSIVVQGSVIDLPQDNALTTEKVRECVGRDPFMPVEMSGRDGVVVLPAGQASGVKGGLVLVDPRTGESSEPLPAGKAERLLVRGSLLITYTDVGQVTAYRKP